MKTVELLNQIMTGGGGVRSYSRVGDRSGASPGFHNIAAEAVSTKSLPSAGIFTSAYDGVIDSGNGGGGVSFDGGGGRHNNLDVDGAQQAIGGGGCVYRCGGKFPETSFSTVERGGGGGMYDSRDSSGGLTTDRSVFFW